MLNTFEEAKSMRLSAILAVGFSAAIIAVLSGCVSSLQGAPTVLNGPAIAHENGGAQLRYNSLRRLSVTERLIHSFGAAGDGYYPEAALLDVNGTFYGTTHSGSGASGSGSVFRISPSGKETLLHTFTGTDGAYPLAKVINVNGALYGTTASGGANGYGTVFSITQSGKLITIYNFTGGSDGAYPQSALTNVNGTLYGTALEGGTYNNGTVFSVTITGHEAVLHSFGAPRDGMNPYAGLINIKGTLYGTTFGGGDIGCNPSEGCGTVFSVTTSGREKVLYTFSGPPDGRAPEASLTNVNGMMYGTTGGGGSKSCECGTVFSIDTSGNENVLHSFGASYDGQDPMATLLNVNGMLYGTTAFGGAHALGTVFTITTSGQEAVLYSFKGLATGHLDGSDPESGLIDVKGTLYGTTERGGAYNAKNCAGYPRRCGTVFSISL